MDFLTEFFARPRPMEAERFRNALVFLESMSPADRADIGIKPADFPRMDLAGVAVQLDPRLVDLARCTSHALLSSGRPAPPAPQPHPVDFDAAQYTIGGQTGADSVCAIFDMNRFAAPLRAQQRSQRGDRRIDPIRQRMAEIESDAATELALG